MSLDTATLITTFCQPIAPVSLPGQTLFKPNQPRRPGRSTYEKVEFAAATCFLGHDIADCSPSPSPPALCPRKSKETPQPGASPENYTLLKLCVHVQLVTETAATPWPGPVIRCGGERPSQQILDRVQLLGQSASQKCEYIRLMRPDYRPPPPGAPQHRQPSHVPTSLVTQSLHSSGHHLRLPAVTSTDI